MTILLGEVKYEISLTVDINDAKMVEWAKVYLEKLVMDQIDSCNLIPNMDVREFDDRETVDPDDLGDRDMEHYQYNKKLQEGEEE